MKHLFHMFDHVLKTFKGDRSHEFRLDLHHFLMFSYHDQTLEVLFHKLLEKQHFKAVETDETKLLLVSAFKV